MKVIVCAMDCEAAAVAAAFEGVSEDLAFGRHLLHGMVSGEPALLIISGIGKSNAAAATQLALCMAQLKPGDELYNFGLSGGLRPEMSIGDVREVSAAVEYDFDLANLNGLGPGVKDERTQPMIPLAPKGIYPADTLATGDRLSDTADGMLHGAGLRDMEGAAVADVCDKAGILCRSFKVVTDVVGHGSMSGQYRVNRERCLTLLSEVARTVFGLTGHSQM